jgi:hypothetical protein
VSESVSDPVSAVEARAGVDSDAGCGAGSAGADKETTTAGVATIVTKGTGG